MKFIKNPFGLLTIQGWIILVIAGALSGILGASLFIAAISQFLKPQ